MRYSAEIERALVAQIQGAPDRAVVLPEWAYWADDPQPWIYVDQQPIRLIRWLYQQMIGPLWHDKGLVNLPDVDRRNVNPYLAVVVPTRGAHAVCPNGHRYTPADFVDGIGHRCLVCRAADTGAELSPPDLNRLKTRCPKGHPLVLRPNGRRRCYQCPRDAEKARRARQKETS